MQTATAARFGASTLPFIFATTSAALLFAASGTANVTAAVAKHDTWSGAFVAGAVASSVALLVAVALPAAVSAFRARQWATALLATFVFALTASYSVTSALGVLGKPRLEASLSASNADARRGDLRAERKRAVAELETLAPARSAVEVNGLIASKLGKLGSRDACRKQETAFAVKTCTEVAMLQEEASRSTRRSALAGTITRVEADLAVIGSPTLANADAAAIVVVLAALGVVAEPNVVNVVLMLIAVTLLEVGSGLSLAVAQSLRVVARVEPIMRDVTPSTATATEAVQTVAASSLPASTEPLPAIVPAPAPSATVQDAASKIVRLVRDAGGELRVSSKRELGRLAGVSHPTAGRALAAMAATGAVVVGEAGEIIVRLAA